MLELNPLRLRPIDGPAMRQNLIDAKLLRPAASDETTAARIDSTCVVFKLDDAGHREAARCLALGKRDRGFDRSHDGRGDI